MKVVGRPDSSPYICAVRSGMRSIAFSKLKMMIGEGCRTSAWRVLKTVTA